jgi:hypothetical protein
MTAAWRTAYRNSWEMSGIPEHATSRGSCQSLSALDWLSMMPALLSDYDPAIRWQKWYLATYGHDVLEDSD